MHKVWMDGHGWRPGTYFQYVLASSHFLGHFGEILESVHALLFSHFNYFFHTLSTACNVYCDFMLLPSKESFLDPPTFQRKPVIDSPKHLNI